MENVIEIKGVKKTFRDFWLRPTVAAVDGLDLAVPRGEVFGLLGPNGSGKSTTIKMILGLLTPTAGTVRLFGLPPQALEARAKLGYLPELSYLHPFLTARETLGYYAGLSNLTGKVAKERTQELLEMVKLADVADRPVGGFSKGMARRVALAASVIGRPELLVMDEPTSGLDPVSTKEVKTLVRTLAGNGMTILMTSHLLADAEDVCDRVMILNHGRSVAEGRVADLGESLEDFFLAKVDAGDDFAVAPFLTQGKPAVREFPFRGATFDSRLVKPGMLYVALKGEKADGNDFIPQALEKGAAKVIGGPNALAELQALARDYRRSLKAKVIGVTGSAGKTTTKELLKAFLSRVGKTYATEGNFNNHLGLPITILNCPPDADFLVLEMGTNHPGEIAALCDIAEPDAALMTNVGTAHLEFFRTQDGIAEEKGTLFRRAKEFSAVSTENVRFEKLRAMCAGECLAVDPHPAWLAEALADVLPGAHNVSNAALAFAVAERYGATRGQAVAALADFALPGARWRKVAFDGVTYVDDTYNANPDSMIAALDAFAAMPCDGKRVAVLGDMFELGADSEALHRKVFDHARALGIPLVIGVGEQSSKCLCNLAYKTLDPLRKKFRVDVSAGDLVLLKASHAMHLGDLIPDGAVPVRTTAA